MIVVDASVAVKWLAYEDDSPTALRLLRSGSALLAPELIHVEVLSALVRKVRVGEMSARAARKAVRFWHGDLQHGGIVTSPDSLDLAGAVEIGLDIMHAVQDCLYLAAAERLSVPLVTADPRFAARAQRRYASVRLLASLP